MGKVEVEQLDLLMNELQQTQIVYAEEHGFSWGLEKHGLNLYTAKITLVSGSFQEDVFLEGQIASQIRSWGFVA